MSTKAMEPQLSPSEDSMAIDIRSLDESVSGYVRKILSEKESLAVQNSQLWKIIQKQRLIIQQLQKTLAKKEALAPTLGEEIPEEELFEGEYKNLNTSSSLREFKDLEKEKNKVPSLTRNLVASVVPTETIDSSTTTKHKVNRLRSQSVNKEPRFHKENFQKHSRSKTVLNFNDDGEEVQNVENKVKTRDKVFSRQVNPSDVPSELKQKKQKDPIKPSLTPFEEESEKDLYERNLNENQISFDIKESSNNVVNLALENEEIDFKAHKDFKKLNIRKKRDTIKDTLLDFYLEPESENASPTADQFPDNPIENLTLSKQEPVTKKVSSASIRSMPEPSGGKVIEKSLTRKSSLQVESQSHKTIESDSNDVSTGTFEVTQIVDINEESAPKESKVIFNTDSQITSVENLKSLDGIVAHVVSSSVSVNSKGREVLSFRILVNKVMEKDDNDVVAKPSLKSSNQPLIHLWTIEKFFSDFLDLDSKLKASPSYTKSNAIKLPEKKSLNTISPSKIDQRKLALQTYLQSAIDSNRQLPNFVSDFINSGRVENIESNKIKGMKEGYLIKRGKNFGKWKRRYFVLKSSILEYFESKNGQRLGSITLQQAQVAVQHTSSSEYEPDATTSDAFRHAFMILEPKKASTTMNRHVLCADSDQERDEWVEAISFYLKRDFSTQSESELSPILDISSNNNASLSSLSEAVSPEESNEGYFNTNLSPTATSMASATDPSQSNSVGIPKDAPEQSAFKNTSTLPTVASPTEKSKPNDLVIPSKSKNRSNSKVKTEAIGSIVSSIIQKKDERDSPVSKEKGFKQFFWNKKMFSSENVKSKAPQLPVFGVPLSQSVLASKVSEGYELPSVVYRCIQYLDAKEAHKEEGIYRLSGSSATIRTLKTKFDTEGDYPLLDSGVYYDVHAVAGLLKLYLRELPSTVLTAELHRDFLQITDLLSRKERVSELGRLICSLPIENYTLLRALIGHLMTVIQDSETNKMNIRNIAIVFAPTLGIPAGVFSLLIAEFKYVFFVDSAGSAAPLEVSEDEELTDIPSDSMTTNTSNLDYESKNSSTIALQKDTSKDSTNVVGIPINNVPRFPEHDSYENSSKKKSNHRRTMSADNNAEMAKVLYPSLQKDSTVDHDKAMMSGPNPLFSETSDVRPTSAYSDTSYLAPAVARSQIRIDTSRRGFTFMAPLEIEETPETSEDRNNNPEDSPTLPSEEPFVALSPTIKLLKKKRSNRNSLIYKSSAPPELVRLEERLRESPQVEDDLIEDEALSNEI
ncbi:RhoGAP-domain-containing protein [Neoconidiobolus thromboides FSU 785]|nr:RhoGAP-domain-containing protein [Neoconidiobolus thromboides FSU 785]